VALEPNRRDVHKKMKGEVDVDLLSDMKAAPPPNVSTEATDNRHEIDKYLSLPVTEVDALSFWKQTEAFRRDLRLPVMSFIAKQLLAIPATSTPSERVFSACGATLNERRARMNTETLEKLMFLKYNMQP
jgi:hypothetical protein